MNDDVFTAYRQDIRNLGQRTNSLVLGHLALVIQIALRYKSSGLPLADLVQSGNVGLLLAAQKFDPERGFQFSTYASLWIRKTIGDAIKDEATSIRLPRYRAEQLARLREARSLLLLEQGSSEPLPWQLAEMLGCSQEMVRQLLRIEQGIQILSLDEPLRAFEDGTLADQLPADEQEQPEMLFLLKNRKEQLVALIVEALFREEREVLMLCFQEDREMTTQEIATELGRVPDTITRIKKRAIQKLKTLIRERQLEEFL